MYVCIYYRTYKTGSYVYTDVEGGGVKAFFINVLGTKDTLSLKVQPLNSKSVARAFSPDSSGSQEVSCLYLRRGNAYKHINIIFI